MPSLRPIRRTVRDTTAVLDRLGLGGSRLALGVAGLGGAWGPVDDGEARETLQQALALGVRVFDTAPSYGTAETLLGEAIARWRGEPLVISTKVGRLPGRDGLELKFDFSPDGMRDSLRRSLDVLGVPRVDLLFLHEPEYVALNQRPRVVETLRQLKADGLTRHLGIAGGGGTAWDGFVETGVFEVAMLFRQLDAVTLEGLAVDLPRLQRRGIPMYGASPLHMGLLGSRFEEFTRDRPEWVWSRQIDRALRLREVAARHGLSLPTLAHRFLFSVGEVERVVIGARNPAELHDAWAAWTAGPLTEEMFDVVCRAAD